jgi:hypothetical protein
LRSCAIPELSARKTSSRNLQKAATDTGFRQPSVQILLALCKKESPAD